MRGDEVVRGFVRASRLKGRQKVASEEPVGRPARPAEIAAAVLWLCSDESSFVVGHAMVVDGGQTV
jgi:NAD(P)-dependent dehydrogenase (short-subunit alcohol dehydrogenase family)